MKTLLRALLVGWLIPIFCPAAVMYAYLEHDEASWEFGVYILLLLACGRNVANTWEEKKWTREYWERHGHGN